MIEYGVCLLRRAIVAHGYDRHQPRQFCVQPDGHVQPVTRALVLGLNQRAFDFVQLRFQPVGGIRHDILRCGAFRALRPLADLRACAANLVDVVVRLGELVPDLQHQGELGIEVFLRRVNARVLDHLEGLSLRLLADGEPDLI